MRIQRAIIWLLLLLAICELLPNAYAYANGYRLAKQQHYQHHHHHPKRMVWPPNLYADFAAINYDPAGNDVALDGGDGTAAADGKNDGNKNKNCPDAKCDVSKIMKPGDPKEKSSSIAIKAAQDAKAANEAQQAAGQLAAQHIKQELAERAFQSAKAAEAALTGKQMVVQQLEHEMQEAQAVVEEESSSLQNTEANMNVAVDAARAATQQFETLTALEKSVKENLSNIQTVALGSQQEMTAKVQLLEAARNRLTTLQKQLQGAREDFEKTKQAAYRAACAAVEAKQKASSLGEKRQRRQRPRQRIHN